MLVIGLTGGIGSGKTTAANYFDALGVPIIDTDLIARELVEPGQPALAAIVNQLGTAFQDASGRLQRQLLREHIFNHPEAKQWLENLLHPLIRQIVLQRLSTLKADYCIVVIPLLLESGFTDIVDQILVVDTPTQLQYQRLQDRDQLNPEQITAILQQQTSRDERLAIANQIIHNHGDLVAVAQQVQQLHQYYLNLAKTFCD